MISRRTLFSIVSATARSSSRTPAGTTKPVGATAGAWPAGPYIDGGTVGIVNTVTAGDETSTGDDVFGPFNPYC